MSTTFTDTLGQEHSLELNAYNLTRVENRFGLNLLTGGLPADDIPLCLNLITYLIAPELPEEEQAQLLSTPEVAESALEALTQAIIEASSDRAQEIYQQAGF